MARKDAEGIIHYTQEELNRVPSFEVREAQANVPGIIGTVGGTMGVVGGALVGAGLGSNFGPAGTAVGGVAGAAGGGAAAGALTRNPDDVGRGRTADPAETH